MGEAGGVGTDLAYRVRALDVRAGEAVLTRAGERVRYSTPDPDGADYVAVCVPAFAPDAAHREE